MRQTRALTGYVSTVQRTLELRTYLVVLCADFVEVGVYYCLHRVEVVEDLLALVQLLLGPLLIP